MAITIQPGQRAAHDFLKKHKVGVLATVSPNCDPYAAAVYYAVDSALNVSFLTKTGTKKADNLEHNNHAMLVVYEAESQTTVQVTGSVSKITDLTEMNEVFAQVVYASVDASHTDIPPFIKLDEGEYVAYRLKPTQVRMAVFSHAKSGGYDTLFKTITPKEN
ncbi:MAG TPA: pyridoxamine 5'-phosphate oxidase family protein [Candidatus Saccharimonadales bacterium]|nr:pyridoxamine 5'-phosphate oxidase family protein [Candidatus Saccharimonadales bacterium]